MLVLDRYVDESIVIDENIIVTINKVTGEKVRLGITAPKHISVHRKEIQDAIIKERQGCGVGDKSITAAGL